MKDSIEFYNEETKNLVAAVYSGMVPTVKSFISIRKQTWEVVSVTYALDAADDYSIIRIRANVNLVKR